MIQPGDGREISVSVIILTKNGERYLRSLLEGVFSQRTSRRVEVIVIDSGSTDGSPGILADFPAIRHIDIPPEEFGHGRTRNLGARLAGGEFLIFIPQDATPADPGWLDALLEPFADPGIAGVFARQIPRADANAMEKHFLTSTYHLRTEVRRLGPGEGDSLARCFFSTVSGAVRASVWRDHPFREDIIMSEDQAWAREAMLAGQAIAYQPAARVWHSHQYGIPEIFRRNFDSGYSIRQIYAGRTGIPLGRALAALLREAVFVLGKGTVGDRLRLLPYEMARHLGFWAGLHADRFPLRLRKACSGLRYFWDQQPGKQRT